MTRPFTLTCRLAVRDWFDDRLLSLCGVLTLASVLAPLLILFGVRFGVVEAMRDRLLQDPAILSITPTGSGTYTAAWLKDLVRRPQVAFGTLSTRSIAATMQLTRLQEATPSVTVSVIPTGADDPLLLRNGVLFKSTTDDRGRDPVVLSEPVARKLGVEAGDTADGIIGRKTPAGMLESVRLPLRVIGVLPLSAEDKDVVFTNLSLLETLEDYRNYIAVPQRRFTGNPPPIGPRQYPTFRLSAQTLDDVAAIRDRLIVSGIETYTRARDIEYVKDIDKSLRLVFWLISFTACAGFMAATTSNVLAAVRRKSRHLGMLRLIGLPGVTLFPLIQALLTGFMGTMVAGLLFLGTGLCINTLFAAQTGGVPVCRLSPLHFGLALLLVLLLSALSALQAARQAARLEPSDAIREI